MKEKDFLNQHGYGADPARLRILYEQYVSPETARTLVEKSAGAHFDDTIVELTVLFGDISNFTQLVQKIDLNIVAEFLREFFSLFTTTIYQNGGTLDKFMGDGVLAIFGAPVALDNQADNALECGRILLKQFQLLRRKYQHDFSVFNNISLGIGLSCSEMFIGNLGSHGRFDYTVIGVGVNSAQRLASHCSSDAILVTDEVLQRVTTDIVISKTEELVLKGFDRPFVVHHTC